MDVDQAEDSSDGSEGWCRSRGRQEKDAKCARETDGESEVSSESNDMLAHRSCRIPQTQRESSSDSSSSSESDSEAGNQRRHS
jgi:hypothetical protein